VFDGVKRRFDTGRLFLTRRLKRPDPKQHKVENWHQVAAALELPAALQASPRLDHSRYGAGLAARFFANPAKPVICLHTGARIAVRRWPEEYFARIVGELRKNFDFHLIVVPEPQSASSPVLAEIADAFVAALNVREMVDLLGRADLVLCNDSGPGHIAAGCGRPVITIFGPSDPDWFRPWGGDSTVIVRDICKWRPCFDYCHFSEPYCMTKLLPEAVWPEIDARIRELVAAGKLPGALLKTNTPTEFTGV
jgi:heptosyltransferase-2